MLMEITDLKLCALLKLKDTENVLYLRVRLCNGNKSEINIYAHTLHQKTMTSIGLYKRLQILSKYHKILFLKIYSFLKDTILAFVSVYCMCSNWFFWRWLLRTLKKRMNNISYENSLLSEAGNKYVNMPRYNIHPTNVEPRN